MTACVENPKESITKKKKKKGKKTPPLKQNSLIVGQESL
jgi:hypothetical protein